MILVNIHRLSQTILLQSGEKSGKVAYFFMLTPHYQGVFKETHFSKKKERSFQTPVPMSGVMSRNLRQRCLIFGLLAKTLGTQHQRYPEQLMAVLMNVHVLSHHPAWLELKHEHTVNLQAQHSLWVKRG